jgi:ribosome biogenesis GTPase
MSKKKKVRVELRKNRTKPPRENDLTQQFQENADAAGDAASGERVRAKGELSRHRTVLHDDAATGPAARAADAAPGRVLRVHGLYSFVEAADGRVVRCTVRRVLKSLNMDERSVVTTGDLVQLVHTAPGEGVIEHVLPRQGVLTRASRWNCNRSSARTRSSASRRCSRAPPPAGASPACGSCSPAGRRCSRGSRASASRRC